MILIVDYKAGNTLSIKNMLKKAGVHALLSSEPEKLSQANKLILPGVGHFDYGMQQLRRLGLVAPLKQKVLVEKVHILGICLGAQLLTKGSEEGKEAGLGWLEANTLKFRKEKLGPGLKTPHMGWCEVEFLQKEDPLFCGLPTDSRFYFVHSYHIVCERDKDIAIRANYGHPFVAGVKRGNIIGVQFHPEKSHKFGMQLLKNFIEL
jgi:glutamine amidotransferase